MMGSNCYELIEITRVVCYICESLTSFCAGCSADGGVFVSVGDDKQTKVWQSDTRRQMHKIEGVLHNVSQTLHILNLHSLLFERSHS